MENKLYIFDVEGMLVPEGVCHIRMKAAEFDRFIDTVLGGEGVIYRFNGIRYMIFSSDSLPTIYEEIIDSKNGKNKNQNHN